MYPAVTLYPNGGFMMCESVSEFDTNVQSPRPAIDTTAVAKLNEIDPVSKAITKLSDMYHQRIVPMLTDTYESESPEGAIDRFDRLIGDVNAIANTMRCMVVKLEALNSMYDREGESPIYDSFRPHVGYFMLNANKIRQQGIEYSQYTYHRLPAFRNFYDTKQLVSIMLQNPQIMGDVIFGSHIQAFLGEYDDNKLTRTFEGLIDMLKCVFEDPARMSRLEETNTCKISFSDLMRACSETESDTCRESTRTCKSYLLKLLSNTCRDVSQCCYSAICDLTAGGEIDHGCMSECLQSCLMKTVNLFAIGVAVVLTYATSLRGHIAYENGITEYTAMLLNTLKSV